MFFGEIGEDVAGVSLFLGRLGERCFFAFKLEGLHRLLKCEADDA